MTPLENLLAPQVTERIGWTLVHFVWQAAAVALLLAVVLRLLRKRSASARYIVSCLALGLIVAMPIVTIPYIEVEGPIAEVGPAPLAPAAEPAPVEVIEVADLPAESFEAIPPAPADAAVRASWTQRVAATLKPALPYLVCGWLLGVFGLSTWHLGGWAQLQRMKRRMVREVAAPLHAKLAQLAQRLGVHRAVGLLESALVEVPTVVGWIKPVILLPASVLSGLSPAQLEAILAHELDHIRRYDYLVNMIQTVVEILGFYHPAVWWISHRIRDERENCCDDLAVRICGDSVGYARALTCLEEMRHHRPELAVAANGGSLVGRIARLLGRPAQTSHRFAWLPGLITLLLIAALLIPTALVLAAPDTPTAIERPQAKPRASERVSAMPAAEVATQPAEGKQHQESERVIIASIFTKLEANKVLDRETIRLLADTLSIENPQAAEEITDFATRRDTTLSDIIRTYVVGKDLAPMAIENLQHMLEKRGYASVRARPQVIVYDNERAEIRTIDELPWPDENGTSPTRWMELGSILKVTPHLSPKPDGPITLEIAAKHTALAAPLQDNTPPSLRTAEMVSTVTTRQDRYVSFLLEPDGTEEDEFQDSERLLIILQASRLSPISETARAWYESLVESDPVIRELQESIAKAERDLIVKQQTMLPEHPEIAAQRKLLEAFKVRVEERRREVQQQFNSVISNPNHATRQTQFVHRGLDGEVDREFGFEELLRSQRDQWIVAKPYMTLYDNDVRCLITADRGTVRISTEDDATAPSPEPVAFEGNVEISLVRSEDESCVLYSHDLTFAAEQGCLSSSGPVRLVYEDTELTGTGLELFTTQTPKSVKAIHTVELDTVHLDQTETGSFVGCLRSASQPQSPTSATQARVARKKEDSATAIRMDFTVLDVDAGATLDRATARRLADILSTVDNGAARLDSSQLRRYRVGPLLEMLHRVTPTASFQKAVDLLVSKGYLDIVTRPTLEACAGQRAKIAIGPDEMTLAVVAETRDNGRTVRMDVNLDLSLREPLTDSTEPNAPVSVRSFQSQVTLEADDQGYALQPLAGVASIAEDAQAFYLLVHPQIVPVETPAAPAAPSVETNLISVLTEIATRTETRIVVDKTVRPIPVRATTDGLSVTSALSRMLEGTPYAFRELSEYTFLVYRPITGSFQGEDLREALHTIGAKAGVRIDCDPNVTGEVYADIRDVPLETALDVMLAGSPFVVKSTPEGYVIAERDTPGSLSSIAKQGTIRVVVRFMQIGTDLRDALQHGLAIKGISSDDNLASLYEIGKAMSQEKWTPLEEAQKQLLLKAIQNDAGSRSLASPAVTVRSGESTEMTMSQEMVYTAGYDEPQVSGKQPQARSATVKPGMELTITPSLDWEDRIVLSGLITLRHLEGFDDRTYRDKYIYQIPRLDVRDIPIDNLRVRNGQAALLFGPHLRWPYNPAPDGAACPTLLVFEATQIENQTTEVPVRPHNPPGMGAMPPGVQQLPGGMGALPLGAEPLPGGMGGR